MNVPLLGRNPLELEPSDIKICIAMASHEMCMATFTSDGMNLAAYTAFNLPDGMHFGTNLITGTYVHSAREKILRQLLKVGVTHILWLDTDMRFPMDSLIRLLKHRKPVVGINYAKREVDTTFVAFKTVAWEPGQESVHLVTGAESTGLEQVEAIGFGMVLMRTAYLKNLPQNEPWFWFEKTPKGQMGEDIYFCRHLKRLGVPIYVDHDLSKECKHTGYIEYDCAMAEMFHLEREQERAAEKKSA